MRAVLFIWYTNIYKILFARDNIFTQKVQIIIAVIDKIVDVFPQTNVCQPIFYSQ